MARPGNSDVRSPAKSLAIGVLGIVVLSASGCESASIARETVFVTSTVATVTGEPAQAGEAPLPERTEVPVTQSPHLESGAMTNDSAAMLDRIVGQGAGIALTPAGGDGQILTAGAWQDGVAWSTIKVPLAIAATRVDQQAAGSASSAIRNSDNTAAESLWAGLGGGASASRAVTEVLAEGGVTNAPVPSVRTRAEYSIFGQTRWSLVDQARFAGALPCLDAAGPVVELMGEISQDQRWGLGQIQGARFKGGWGPGESGGYLVRQFGLVPGVDGDVAVAMAVDAPSFEAGVAILSAMADALAPELSTIRGGRC